MGATESLREFDQAYNVAQDLLQETSGVVNQGWSAIDQVYMCVVCTRYTLPVHCSL